MKKNTKNGAASKAYDPEHAKRVRRIAIITLLLILCGGVVTGLFLLHRALFVTNPRLLLQRVEIRCVSGGFWEEHQTELCRNLGLTPGRSFHDIRPDILRQQLLVFPNIANVEVEILQPDAIRLNITERVPSAVLDANWVVDGNGYILRRGETNANYLTLPVIKEVKHPPYIWIYQKHLPRKELIPALQLCNAIQNYPQLKLSILFIKSDRKLEARLSYMEQPPCRITFPGDRQEKDYRFLVDRFFDAITEARRNGDMRNNFDLSFDGRIIIK